VTFGREDLELRESQHVDSPILEVPRQIGDRRRVDRNRDRAASASTDREMTNASTSLVSISRSSRISATAAPPMSVIDAGPASLSSSSASARLTASTP
jgi:hypothetical protein